MTQLARRVRGVRRLTAFGAVAAVAVAPLVAPSGAAAAHHRDETYPRPPGGTYTLHGRGYGHGHGLSQWGAYGAAKVDGLTARQILAFYYPHTDLASQSADPRIRVLLTGAGAATSGYLEVAPAAGLTATYHGSAHRLPKRSKGTPVTGWRLVRHSDTLRLREQRDGRWHTIADVGAAATFSDRDAAVPVVVAAGGTSRTITYRGSLRAELRSGVVEVVDRLPLEDYLLSVVTAEMPSSWPAASLRAQAVAARTYAAHGMAHPKASWYDVDGDTRDQAYAGEPGETAAGTAAVRHTAGEVLQDSSGQPVLAQFGAANGGWTVSGGAPYLPTQKDPYDGAVPNTAHAWTTTLSADTVQSVYPQLGTLQDIVVTGRDGHGLWGGRVTSVDLVGFRSTVTVSGTGFEYAFGLRSTWWRPTPTPAAPEHPAATRAADGVTVSWSAPHHVKGQAAITGYRISLSPGGAHRRVDADQRSATFTGGKAAAATTVAVSATSDAGSGPQASARIAGG